MPCHGKVSEKYLSIYNKNDHQRQGEISSTEGVTQGDPLAMAFHTVATMPLIFKLNEVNTGAAQAWFADDASAAGLCEGLRHWWDELMVSGPKFGYLPNPAKTFLLVKEEFEENAHQIFDERGITITSSGKSHLGAPLGGKTLSMDSSLQKCMNGYLKSKSCLS